MVGHIAGLSWMALAAVTLAGAIFRSPSLFAINFAMVAIFAAVGAFVVWRAITIDRLLASVPDSIQALRTRQVELVASFSMLVVGLACLAGAVKRVWSEGASVFG